jgi:hypothetical protein
VGIDFEVVDNTSCQQETVSLWEGGVSEKGRSQIMYVSLLTLGSVELFETNERL